MLRIPAFIVIGGGEAGALQVRQLLRAAAAGRLHTERIRVVDRDHRCAATAHLSDHRVRLEVAEWSAWLDRHLTEGADSADHLVPYHWSPHLLRDWLERQARRAGLRVRRAGPPSARGLPFETETTSGDRALSYAAWTCPPLCIEPALCPHTRGPRDWSLAGELAAPRADEPFADRLVLRCTHLVFGVGTIPVADILNARDRLLSAGSGAGGRCLIATSSHCHGLASVLEVGPSEMTLAHSAERR